MVKLGFVKEFEKINRMEDKTERDQLKEAYFKSINPESPYNAKSISGSVRRWRKDIANLENGDGRIRRKGNGAERGALGVGAE